MHPHQRHVERHRPNFIHSNPAEANLPRVHTHALNISRGPYQPIPYSTLAAESTFHIGVAPASRRTVLMTSMAHPRNIPVETRALPQPVIAAPRYNVPRRIHRHHPHFPGVPMMPIPRNPYMGIPMRRR